MTILAKNLKKRRRELRLTQKLTAQKMQVKKSRYATWEQDRAEPNLYYLVKISEVLQIDDLYLFLSRDF